MVELCNQERKPQKYECDYEFLVVNRALRLRLIARLAICKTKYVSLAFFNTGFTGPQLSPLLVSETPIEAYLRSDFGGEEADICHLRNRGKTQARKRTILCGNARPVAHLYRFTAPARSWESPSAPCAAMLPSRSVDLSTRSCRAHLIADEIQDERLEVNCRLVEAARASYGELEARAHVLRVYSALDPDPHRQPGTVPTALPLADLPSPTTLRNAIQI